MSTATATRREGGASRLVRVLGLSPSQAAVRGLLLATSVALIAITLVAAPHGLVVGAVVLLALAGWGAWRPESPAASLLVVGLALHWLVTVPVPVSTQAWLLLLGAALLLLVLHLCAALAASLPPGAPVPGPSLRRWARRGAVVAAATSLLWVLSFTAGREAAPGEVWLTYAAIVATAVLALAVWLLSRDSRR